MCASFYSIPRPCQVHMKMYDAEIAPELRGAATDRQQENHFSSASTPKIMPGIIL